MGAVLQSGRLSVWLSFPNCGKGPQDGFVLCVCVCGGGGGGHGSSQGHYGRKAGRSDNSPFFFFFRAAPSAYGGSQTWGRIGAEAAGL